MPGRQGRLDGYGSTALSCGIFAMAPSAQGGNMVEQQMIEQLEQLALAVGAIRREDVNQVADALNRRLLDLKIINGGCYRNGPNSSPVLTWKPTRSSGRSCIRLRRVFTSAASSARVCLVRLASDRFRCAQTGSTGLSSGAWGGSR